MSTDGAETRDMVVGRRHTGTGRGEKSGRAEEGKMGKADRRVRAKT
jgi:hypothetical protein